MKTKLNESVCHLFDETVQLTGIIEYGISWVRLTEGKAALPPEGAHFDISFEGTLAGKNLNGKIRGTDYLEVRADGRFILNIQATIITNDGESIALHEDGILTPSESGKEADLFLNMKFTTHAEKYRWLNKTNVWGIGKVDMGKGKVQVSAFAASEIPVLIEQE